MMPGLLRLLESFAGYDDSPPRLLVSDAFPDVALKNQFGESLSFRKDFVESGRALVINSMYTTCRGSCSGTSATIARLRRSLSPVFSSQMAFVSFTLEPEVDTPDVMLSYVKAYGADHRQVDLCEWHFVAASRRETDELRRALGFYDLDPVVDADISEHASLLLVGNPDSDRWCALPADLADATLLESIRRFGGFTFEQKYGIASS